MISLSTHIDIFDKTNEKWLIEGAVAYFGENAPIFGTNSCKHS